MGNKEEKLVLRNRMIQLRDQIEGQERKLKSQLIFQKLLEQSFFSNQENYSSLVICTYMPFRSELDVSPLMEWCWQQGCKVLVPKVVREQKRIRLHAVECYNDLEMGSWGIMEPKQTTPVWDRVSAIDWMFVPGVAFDLQGGRLGYGGGYYDRFIDEYHQLALQRPRVIALAYDMQVVSAIPMESHDLAVDHIITESSSQIVENS